MSPMHSDALRTYVCALAVFLLVGLAVRDATAHPGHEYKISGTISKVHPQQFEVTEADGAKMVFFIIPATEVRVGDARGSVADIRVGAAVVANGVENDKGRIEAKVVHLSIAKK